MKEVVVYVDHELGRSKLSFSGVKKRKRGVDMIGVLDRHGTRH